MKPSSPPKRVLVTGSADGLGYAAAQALIAQGHQVIVHVRSEARRAAVKALDAQVVVGDLADDAQTRTLATQLGALGALDAVIHNAGVYRDDSVMQVNAIAPYLLTALTPRPKRLIYLSSGMHQGGQRSVSKLRGGSYSDSKLFISTFAAALARRWPQVLSNSVNPGWVSTKMGGASAPDDLVKGHETQVWLAVSDEPEALTSGGYWFHQRRERAHPAVGDSSFQDELLAELERVTSVSLPR